LKLIQLKSIENIENNHRVINSENNIIHTISSIYEEEKNDTNTFEIKSNTEIHLIKNLDNSKDSTKDVNTEKQLFEKSLPTKSLKSSRFKGDLNDLLGNVRDFLSNKPDNNNTDENKNQSEIENNKNNEIKKETKTNIKENNEKEKKRKDKSSLFNIKNNCIKTKKKISKKNLILDILKIK